MPRPLAEMRAPSDLLGVLCDIDDTLTVDGRLVPGVLRVMAEAQRRGIKIVPVTGRPGGWVDHIARCWPVDGVVGENGGLWYWMDGEKLQRRFMQGPETRQANKARMAAVADRILREVPGSALASDQPYRELDLAIDFCEDVAPLGDQAVQRIVEIFQEEGADAKVSSIHVNGWFGQFDKLAGIQQFHRDCFGGPIDVSRWAFFGDSPNDEPMFGALEHSIGVSNVVNFLDAMTTPPQWITASEGGHGFIEGMNHLLGETASR